ncbi:MAG: Dihydropteroate synthase [Bacteroidetes bacterium ADurb.Bin145]|nr:MAG: Dihydropteroate synthase [Bacteroidetes bacterium ADurb.Bin145]
MPERPRYINIKGKLLDLSKPRVMGVINITPDSFYKGSRVSSEKDIIETAARMMEDGADIIDIGGYSSRPYADDITPEEERNRLLGPLKMIIRELPQAVISVDTFRSEIAREAIVDCGAHIINDISSGEADKNMFSLVAELNVPYIMMHMKGDPASMQNNPVYDDVVADIMREMSSRIVKLRAAGVKDLIFDPGFGFGKTIIHNFEMLRRLHDFSIAGLPILVGVSRKSMIWKTLSITPEDALNGTTVLNTVALLNGADILRVHDVKEAVQAVKLITEMRKTKDN